MTRSDRRPRRAVVLLSGGLDSATCLLLALEEGWDVFTLSFDYAESVGASDIFIGANILDYSGYPDCRPEFLEAFEAVANLGTKAGSQGETPFRIRAPLLRMTKGQIVRRAASLGLDFALTASCYDPGVRGRPCDACGSCLLRAKGFAEAGIADPLER